MQLLCFEEVRLKINIKQKEQLLIKLYDKYVEVHGQSLSQLGKKEFYATATDGYGVDGVKDYLSIYLKELEAREYLHNSGDLSFTLTKSGFIQAYTLKHPVKAFLKKNQQLVATIVTSVVTTIATVTVTLWSGVFAQVS